MRVYTIGALEANQRLDKYLVKLLKNGGHGFTQKMLRKKNIVLNGKKAAPNTMLKEGDEVKLFMTDETIDRMRGVLPECAPEIVAYKEAYEKLKKRIEIVHEDDHVLFINKPAGVLAQKSDPKDISCNEWLIGYMLKENKITVEQLNTFKPSICNRLDRNTSGLVICGKTLLGSQKMNQLIRDREIKKFYRLFVKGTFEKPVHIDGYLKKDYAVNKSTILQKALEGTDRIETTFTPIETGHGISYIEAELITGKPHQIRAHVASINFPILGDYKYGHKNANEILHLRHQVLHAYRLELPRLDGEFKYLSRRVIIAKEPWTFEKLKRYMRDIRDKKV